MFGGRSEARNSATARECCAASARELRARSHGESVLLRKNDWAIPHTKGRNRPLWRPVATATADEATCLARTSVGPLRGNSVAAVSAISAVETVTAVGRVVATIAPVRRPIGVSKSTISKAVVVAVSMAAVVAKAVVTDSVSSVVAESVEEVSKPSGFN